MTDCFDLPKKRSSAAVDLGSLPPETQKKLEGLDDAEVADALGVAGKDTDGFDAPNLIQLPNEKILKKGNSYIRFGKDRHTNRFSGFGGKGNSHCAAIDLVAGAKGWGARKRNRRNREVYVDPDFKVDAARVYISQKSNVDGYFGLPAGHVGNTDSDNPRSTVALKADTVRLIGRENIKLVTRTDQFNSQGGELANSSKKTYGIDLIAVDDDADLQPMVKGDNLVDCLESIIQMITNMTTILDNFMTYQGDFNIALQSHTHMTAFYGAESAPDFKQLMQKGVKNQIDTTLNCQVPTILDTPMDTVGVKNDYLEGGASPGAKYILSSYNRTN